MGELFGGVQLRKRLARVLVAPENSVRDHRRGPMHPASVERHRVPGGRARSGRRADGFRQELVLPQSKGPAAEQNLSGKRGSPEGRILPASAIIDEVEAVREGRASRRA